MEPKSNGCAEGLWLLSAGVKKRKYVFHNKESA